MRNSPTKFKKGMKPTKTSWKPGTAPLNIGKICINNGLKIKWHNPSIPIPKGWRKGNIYLKRDLLTGSFK